ncbi:hypothetical protein COO60DRAFT_1200439 [Scenedesmus sp. NREL 46B-D3]|nr:hypothetical protein COO60DRAFT_1200439 [Scenedesmus sp. NREL 46B-D3]
MGGQPSRHWLLWQNSSAQQTLAACFDSAVKPNRYNSAGRSGGYMGAAAVLGLFLGKAHDKLWHMTSSGELYVAQSRIAELGADEVSIEVDGECHPILTCSRLTSQRSGLCDAFGLTGSVCSHGQPLLDMFLAMPAPERFLYYDLALQELASPGVADVELLLRLAGRLAARFAARLADTRCCVTSCVLLRV